MRLLLNKYLYITIAILLTSSCSGGSSDNTEPESSTDTELMTWDQSNWDQIKWK